MISVPDLRTLSWLYSRPDIDISIRMQIMWVIFGGQTNKYDVHKVGFDIDILWLYLSEVGFEGCTRVSEFNLFNDCSNYYILNTQISLNVIATK